MERSFNRTARTMILCEGPESIRDSARKFARRALAPYSAEGDRAATFRREALREPDQLGSTGMTVPAHRKPVRAISKVWIPIQERE